MLEELSSVSVERDRHLQAAEKLRVIRDELIEKAFRTKIPRKTIAAASLLKEISLYKMMARRIGPNGGRDSEPEQPDLFSHMESEEPMTPTGDVSVPTFSAMRGH